MNLFMNTKYSKEIVTVKVNYPIRSKFDAFKTSSLKVAEIMCRIMTFRRFHDTRFLS